MPKGIYKRTKYHIDISKKLAKQNFKGKPSWNKGLTKETDERVKKYSEKIMGIKFTKKHRNKISKALKGRVSWSKNKKCPQFSGKNNYFFGKHFKGKNHPYWKGGKTKDKDGYIYIYKPKHPFHNNKNYVLKHRLVVEKHIGRYLLLKEQTHHLNENTSDNKPQNLMAFTSNSAHQRFHKNPNNVKPSEIIFDGRKLKT